LFSSSFNAWGEKLPSAAARYATSNNTSTFTATQTS
jgi:hypothetical protein